MLSSLGYGLPDDIVIEKRGKGDTFVDCTGADVKISSIKFVQHDAVEGILSKYLYISFTALFSSPWFFTEHLHIKSGQMLPTAWLKREQGYPHLYVGKV